MAMYKSPEQLALEAQLNSYKPALKKGLFSSTGFRNIPKPVDSLASYTANPIENFSATENLNTTQEPIVDNSFSRNLLQGSINTAPIFKQPELGNIQASKDYTVPTQVVPNKQPKTNILGEPTQKTFGGVTVTKDVNGNPVISNTSNPYEGMFTGISKERDAALNQYGKVDKNSEWYKRNKQVMENL